MYANILRTDSTLKLDTTKIDEISSIVHEEITIQGHTEDEIHACNWSPGNGIMHK